MLFLTFYSFTQNGSSFWWDIVSTSFEFLLTWNKENSETVVITRGVNNWYTRLVKTLSIRHNWHLVQELTCSTAVFSKLIINFCKLKEKHGFRTKSKKAIIIDITVSNDANLCSRIWGKKQNTGAWVNRWQNYGESVVSIVLSSYTGVISTNLFLGLTALDYVKTSTNKYRNQSVVLSTVRTERIYF